MLPLTVFVTSAARPFAVDSASIHRSNMKPAPTFVPPLLPDGCAVAGLCCAAAGIAVAPSSTNATMALLSIVLTLPPWLESPTILILRSHAHRGFTPARGPAAL